MGNTGTVVPSDLQFQRLTHTYSSCTYISTCGCHITDMNVCNRLHRSVTECVIMRSRHARLDSKMSDKPGLYC